MDLIFNVNGQVIKPNKKYEIYSDMKNYLTAVFRFSDDWDGLEKTALFISADGTAYKMLLVNNECTVPWEVIDTPYFGISVYGGDLLPSSLYLVPVHESGYTDAGVDPAEPTPDIYNQLIETVQAERNLALAAADLANTKAALADEKAIAANTAAGAANTAADLANTKAALADEKAIYADEQGGYALEQGGYALEQGGYAESIVNTINVNGIVKGDGAGNFSAADAGDMPITDEDEHFTAGTVEGALEELADNKADKVAGKALSTNDYTDADKAKVDNLPDDTNTALTETNLRIATVDKSLSDYQNAIASINANQSPKQTASGYGTVSLPVNAANGQVSCVVGGNTVTDENGTNSTISAGRLVSENEDETETTYQYYSDVGLLRSLPNGVKDEIRVSEKKLIKKTGYRVVQSSEIDSMVATHTNVDWVLIKKSIDDALYGSSATSLATSQQKMFDGFVPGGVYSDNTANIGTHINFSASQFAICVAKGTYASVAEARTALVGKALTYQLASPIVTPINVTGTLVGYPNGTIYFEPVLPVAGIYTASGIEVTDTDFPIDYIEKIAKIDFMTGVETEVDVSQAVIASDGLSFTHAELADGDIVFFTYYHDVEGTQPKIDVEYYDSRYTVEDSAVSGTFYAWKVTVTNGTPTLSVEVV